METLNTYKGYGQLNHLEDQIETKPSFQNPNKTRKISIAITFLILLTLIIASIIAALIHHSQTEQPHEEEEQQEQQQPSVNSATHSIQLVCNVTQYPDSCFLSLSSINTKSNPDPQFLFSLSLQAAIKEASKLASLPESLSSRVNDPRTQSALKDCKSLLNDAFDRLNQSAEAARGGHVASSHRVKISDVNTWISAAMTDQETCLDGLEEMESTVVDEVREKIKGSKVCMSNSLAILANIKGLIEKFHYPVSGGHLSNNNHI